MEDKFLELFAEILEREEPLMLKQRLEDLEEWDSLAALALVSMLDDEYGVIMGSKEFEKMETVQDILNSIIENKQGSNEGSMFVSIGAIEMPIKRNKL